MHRDSRFLQHARAAIEDADVLAISPDVVRDSRLSKARLWRVLTAGRPVISISEHYSLGADSPPPQRAEALELIRELAERISLDTHLERLGYSAAGAHYLGLALPLTPDDNSRRLVAAGVRELRSIVERVTILHGQDLLGVARPLTEPDFLASLAKETQSQIALDLPAVVACCENSGTPTESWLELLPLARVETIVLSGDSLSEATALASGRRFRLVDAAKSVSESVWQAFASLLPRCPDLRFVLLRTDANDFSASRARALSEDLRTARACL